MVTALLPFLPKPATRITRTSMFDSVKMEEVSSASLWDREDVPSASQTPSSMLQRTNLKISSEQSVAENEQD
jgi:hypothetical protein